MRIKKEKEKYTFQIWNLYLMICIRIKQYHFSETTGVQTILTISLMAQHKKVQRDNPTKTFTIWFNQGSVNLP